MEDFSNKNLDVLQLPQIESLDYQSLHKNYLSEMLIGRIILAIAVFILIFLTGLKDKNPYIFEFYLAAIVLLFGLLIQGYLGFYKKAYALREKDVTYKKGLIFNSITTIPLNRIQHSELARGPLDRLLGLSSIKIFTAGGSSSDITIPGVELKEAERLRGYLNKKIQLDDNE